jgi:hypothetical protein
MPWGRPPQHDNYDDGLVHDHGWACRERGRMVHRPPVETLPEVGYDDGLVHGHAGPAASAAA